MIKNKIVLITGSTDGIGKQTAIELALLGARVIVHGRKKNLVEKTVEELRRLESDSKVDGFTFDLSSLLRVREFAARLKEHFDHIDVLINNAGVYIRNKTLSDDGFEMTFAVNHLSHFLLTNELLPLLKQSNEGRIIHVSSMAHQNAKLDWTNLNAEKYYDPYGAYSLSKLANVLFSNELSERLNGSKVTSNSLHPGVITTKLLAAGFNISGSSVKKGAETSVYLATDNKIKDISGKYFVDKKISRYNSIADDGDVRKIFWKISSEFVGLN
jgi:retinol dehydrogenase 14